MQMGRHFVFIWCQPGNRSTVMKGCQFDPGGVCAEILRVGVSGPPMGRLENSESVRNGHSQKVEPFGNLLNEDQKRCRGPD
jgi:hypothetical protein